MDRRHRPHLDRHRGRRLRNLKIVNLISMYPNVTLHIVNFHSPDLAPESHEASRLLIAAKLESKLRKPFPGRKN